MSTYIHGTSDEEQRRLSLLNDVLLNAASLRELSLYGDESIVDFGSGLGQFSRAMARAVPRGRVVGYERSEQQLLRARELATQENESGLVEFRTGDVLAMSDSAAGEPFDLAHARFVLEHVPDPLSVVRNMVRLVRPGGRIVLADDDHDVLRLWPEPPGFADLWRAYMRTYDRLGNDPFTGRRLVSLLHEAGAKPVRNTWVFFGGCAGMDNFDVMTANTAGILHTARQAIISMNLFDAGAFDVVMQHYERWSRRPDAAIWFAMSWAEGQRIT